jgi:hypothetical protein
MKTGLSIFIIALLLCAAGPKDSTAQGPIFFSPLDGVFRPKDLVGSGGYSGSVDYQQLFKDGAEWPLAASRTSVFIIWAQWLATNLPGHASDAELREAFNFLARKNISLGLDTSSLEPDATCGQGVETFVGTTEQMVDLLQRPRLFGGEIKVISLDSPVYFGNIYDGPNACHWPISKIVDQVVARVKRFKAVLPDAIIGDIEPALTPQSLNNRPIDWISRYREFYLGYRKAMGSDFAFIHADNAAFGPSWQKSVRALADLAAELGVPFGLFYQGDINDTSDGAWMTKARERIIETELHDRIPEHALFQSWHPYPKHSLPETDSSAFTSIINWYSRIRTKLSLSRDAQRISGSAADNFGRPLPNVNVRVTGTVNSGPGIVSTYRLSGTVPNSLSSALIQICVNQCGSRHMNDMNVYSFQYREPDTGVSTLLDFSNGLTGWGVSAKGTAVVQAASDATGRSARITARAEQDTFVNSRTFAVTPGRPYELIVQARISPDSVGSGYFALIFLATAESTRHTLPFTPAVVNLGSAQTDLNGRYNIETAGEPPGRLLLEALYEGDDSFWPAYASNSFLNLSVPANGAASSPTTASTNSLAVGYATAGASLPNVPYGTAVFTHSENGIIVSEAAVPPFPLSNAAGIFVEYRSDASAGIQINTGLAIVNRGILDANLTCTLRNSAGQVIAEGHGTLASSAHRALFIDQLKDLFSDFNLPSDFVSSIQFGSLELRSDQLLSVVALRLTTNQRGEALLTTVPTADLSLAPTNASIYFPQFVNGGGYTTTLVLLNTSSGTERGTFRLFGDDGMPLAVSSGGSPNSVFTYSIPPGGLYRFQTDGIPAAPLVGWVQLTPDAGSSTPEGAGIFSLTQSAVLVTESGVPSVKPTTHARIYVDKSRGHDTGLAFGNVGPAAANVLVRAYRTDGVTPAGAGSATLSLGMNGHTANFAGALVSGLPESFTGVLDLTSNTPFVALTLRSLTNSRGEFLITTFPVADATRRAPFPIVFPQVAEGEGYATEFILLGAGAASTTKVSFWNQDGLPLGFAQ